MWRFDPYFTVFLLFGIRIEIASHKLIYRLLGFILVFLSHITGERTKVETEARMKGRNERHKHEVHRKFTES